ncbi:hypothetical protein ABTE96_23180, partial [Acinetobacter baumannii]
IGHFFAVLSLVASLLATICFFKAGKETQLADKKNWLTIARAAFLVETISVLALFVTLYYIISHHFFDYKYAYTHSD